ncbi:MAG: class I SAM-dependent methyltransferase [Candidatus Aminicenantales bacterium]
MNKKRQSFFWTAVIIACFVAITAMQGSSTAATAAKTLPSPVALATGQEIQLDVPYVPTRFPVVEEMLRLAAVTKADVVYDLGCGDGRIVIAAAQRFGCRGVGFDIDPERIRECHDNAKKAGVTERVKFIEGDLFQADFREATVLPMYLLTTVNLKLRPKILRELQPGSRVVSHNFAMDNWKADAHTELKIEDVTHDVYLWIVPANVSGRWTWSAAPGGGASALEFKLEATQKFQFPEAAVTLNGVDAAVRNLKLSGDKISFLVEAPLQGRTIVLSFEGKAFNNDISGTIQGRIDGRDVALPWKASRNPATIKPIDDEPAWWN